MTSLLQINHIFFELKIEIPFYFQKRYASANNYMAPHSKLCDFQTKFDWQFTLFEMDYVNALNYKVISLWFYFYKHVNNNLGT